MIDYKVPFYENTDDTHCYQACLKMALKYFEPDKNYSFDQLDDFTQKDKNKPTWPMAGLCWLAEKGYDIVEIEEFDYSRFLEQGNNYLREAFGPEVANYSNSNDEQKVKNWTKKFLKICSPQNRLPKVEDIGNLLANGYLVIAQVNWRRLHNKDGYAGHKVLVKGVTIDELIIHDPGLPGQKNLKISFDKFEHIWSEAQEITAIKLIK